MIFLSFCKYLKKNWKFENLKKIKIPKSFYFPHFSQSTKAFVPKKRTFLLYASFLSIIIGLSFPPLSSEIITSKLCSFSCRWTLLPATAVNSLLVIFVEFSLSMCRFAQLAHSNHCWCQPLLWTSFYHCCRSFFRQDFPVFKFVPSHTL